MVPSHSNWDRNHCFEQFDCNLFFSFINLLNPGLFTLERAGDQLNNIAFDYARNERLWCEIMIYFIKVHFSFNKAVSFPNTPDDFSHLISIHTFDENVSPEISRSEYCRDIRFTGFSPACDTVRNIFFMTD